MHNLKELQINFQNYLLKQNPAIVGQIINTSKIPALSRLEIYRDAYYLRLLEILQQDYNGLYTLLGDEQFDQLCRHYINDHPSQFRSVRWFGQYLPDYIQDFTPYKDHPYLVEMAKFEWLLTEAFDSVDCSTISVEEVTKIQPEYWPEMYFKLHPSIRRLNLNWNTVPLWNAIKDKSEMISPQKSDVPVNWIIWRIGTDTQFYSLSADQAYVIDAMMKGENFGSICVGLCDWVDEQSVAAHAASMLKQFILDHLIAEILLPL